MPSKSDFLRTLIRLSFPCSDVERAAVTDQAASQWASLSAAQRAALIHDDAKCRVFAAGFSAGQATQQEH